MLIVLVNDGKNKILQTIMFHFSNEQFTYNHLNRQMNNQRIPLKYVDDFPQYRFIIFSWLMI